MSTGQQPRCSSALLAILLGVSFSSFARGAKSGAGQSLEEGTLRRHARRAGLIARGEAIFFNETFGGNGRTCGTCHPAKNNFTLDPAFIATLPPDDPLFVAEFDPALAGLENPRLLRELGLILENLDGFDQPGVLRGVPHTLGLSTSVSSFAGPRTGWSGDGAPGDRSLRSFAIGAVIQHFTKTLNRVPGWISDCLRMRNWKRSWRSSFRAAVVSTCHCRCR